MVITTFTLKGVPRTKKNSQSVITNPRTGRPMIIQSKAYREYEKECLKQIENLGIGRMKISTPVNVMCLFFMPTKRKVDLQNLVSAAMDILVKGGVLADDNYQIVYGNDGSRVLFDKDNPRTEVVIRDNRI